MSLTQQVSVDSSYFTLSKKKHVCMPPRRVHLVHHDTPKPPSSPQKKKSVRFCSDEALEQVRLFIKTQTPLAVHSDPPLPLGRVDIHYPNWPSKWSMYKSLAAGAMIRMENVQLVENKVLMGRCRVANVAFEKEVTVRYSLDHWKSYREIHGSFRESLGSSILWDRFTFDIDLPSTTTATTCWIALCYHVNQQTFWDNNDGKNYQIDLLPTPSTPPLTDSDEDEEDDDDVLYPPRKPSPLTSRYNFSNAPTKNTMPITTHPLSSPQLEYQDFISKYCFYNSSPPSSIVQN